MKSLTDIERILSKNKHQLFEKYPIEKLAIFGSYARKEQTTESDLDLMVEFKSPVGVSFIDLAEEIENIIGFKVDLVSKRGIKDKYFQAIKSDLIYV